MPRKPKIRKVCLACRQPFNSLAKRNAEEGRLYLYNKQQMYRRDGWHCRHCNRSTMLTPHHVVFQSQGGSDDLNNLLCLCTPCHDDIHDGRMRIEVVRLTTCDLVVKFWHLERWKP
jgi:5-methylcytosine-specific restriction endonuclease McrA